MANDKTPSSTPTPQHVETNTANVRWEQVLQNREVATNAEVLVQKAQDNTATMSNAGEAQQILNQIQIARK